MFFTVYRSSLASLALGLASLAAVAQAADAVILWPAGWEVESLPVAPESSGQPSVQLRQRAVKKDATGEPNMIMELTQTRLTEGHDVNVQGVLLEMRKAIQVNFARDGLQSACTHAREVKLGGVPGVQSTCTITQNGVHVMTQTLVAAATAQQAWSLSYAGSAQAFEANKPEVLRIRESLRLGEVP
ncbi:DUF4946 domain-containing protein [Pseudomonas syringae]|nr:DUF4946 domain-containing protein [Pseudomonas syringae]MBD8790620.1 DUF4946 domain-containing protein [Pseudomonas syringae]MBD8798857.1 DUF4946 domain-containing protein [Pseudomonas syringae]MBD8809684.1 DUF4946 domain-containing protein [Pseudomonas syringae]